MTAKKLAGGVTKEQIEEWKSKYKNIFRIECDRSDEPEDFATCYLKEPTRQTLQVAMRYSSSDPMKMNQTILTNCWLGGDEEIKTTDKLFMSASAQLAEIFEIREARVKKL